MTAGLELAPAELAGSPAIRTRGLVKQYGRKAALAGVDVEVEAGSLYLLAGENGAGKTTLLRVVLDLTSATAGEVFVLGLPSATEGPRIRANVGWVPEGPPPVWGKLRVRQLFRHQRRFYPGWDEGTESSLCQRLGVDAGRRFGSLSKGEKELVMLVLALAHRPAVLVWDEPTACLDPLHRELVVRLLLDEVAAGVTVLVASHQVTDFDGVADRLGVLCSGQLLAQLSTEELRRTFRRYEVETPSDWQPGNGLATHVLPSALGGGLVIRGEEPAIVAALAAQGATVRSVVPLTLGQACVAVMASGRGAAMGVPGDPGPRGALASGRSA